MQAPTTPDPPSAQGPSGTICPSCGATNGTAAVFCWRCYRPFAARAAWLGSPGAAGLPRTHVPASTSPFPAPPPPRKGLGRPVAVLAVAVAAIVGAVSFLSGGGDVRLPESFAGLRQVEDEQVDVAVDEFRATVDTQGVSGDMALYGTGGFPTAALVWVKDPSVPTTDEAFTALADGFNTGLPGGMDPDRRSSASVNGVEYVCASVASVPPAAMCLWQEDEVFWMLFDLAGAGRVRAAQDLAVAAHDAVA